MLTTRKREDKASQGRFVKYFLDLRLFHQRNSSQANLLLTQKEKECLPEALLFWNDLNCFWNRNLLETKFQIAVRQGFVFFVSRN